MTKTHLVVHHSATEDGATVSAQQIRRFHTSWRVGGDIVTEELGRQLQARGEPVTPPWSDVGYHLLVERIGDRYELLFGRPLLARAAAAHQDGMNVRGIHVCFVGNYDLAPPPVAMLEFAVPHLVDICTLASIPLDDEHIIGHRKVAPKTCPGARFDMTALLDRLRGAL